MISRRAVIVGATLAGIHYPAIAKPGDLDLPPPLSDLRRLPLMRPDGSTTTLGDHMMVGRAAVFSLWATWCGPCANEASHLSDVRRKITADKLDMIGINIDRKRDEEKIANFLKRSKVNFTQLRGEPEATYLAFNGQLPISLPRLYIFRPTGAPTNAFGRYDGRATLRAIDQAIEVAMKT